MIQIAKRACRRLQHRQIHPATAARLLCARAGDEVEVGTGQSEYATHQAQTSEAGEHWIQAKPGTDEFEGGCYADPMTARLSAWIQAASVNHPRGMQGGCYQILYCICMRDY